MANIYLAAKQDLLAKPAYSWLAPFGKTFDDWTKAALENIPQSPYDPFQVEESLGDISQILNRCLAYRREYFDLDTTAVKNGLDQDLFNRQLQALMDLDMSPGLETQRKAERVQHALAQNNFKNDPSMRGFLYLANLGVASDDEAVKSEAQRKKDVAAKWKALQDYQATLADRYTAPGNSMNFAWRAQQVISFYSEDIREAYQKAVAVQAGLKLLFGLTIASLPDPKQPDFLNGLVQWNRKTIRELELFVNNDVDFEVVVLGTAKPQKNGLANPLLDSSLYSDEMKDGGAGDLVFNLTDYFPTTLKFLRVRAVAVSFARGLGASASDYNTARLFRTSALVFPPATPDPFSILPGVNQSRPPIVLSNVTLTDPNAPPKFSASSTLNNISPSGEWRLKISKTMSWGDATARARTPDLSDIRLHLRLVAQPSPEHGDWTEFWM